MVLTDHLEKACGVRVRKRRPGVRAGKRTLLVDPLPICRRGLTPDIEPLIAVFAAEDWNEAPPAAEELPSALASTIVEGLQPPWRRQSFSGPWL